MRSAFRDLAAYDRATSLANELHAAVRDWSALDTWTVGAQLIRAVDSIGANIAEASGRWRPADKKRLLVIARGSLCETEHWLVAATDRGLLAETMIDRLDGIARPLSGLIEAHRRR